MLSSKPVKIIAHLFGWLLFFGLIMGFVSNSPGGNNLLMHLLSPYYLLFYLIYIFLFYSNSGFLIRRYYLKKKYVIYFTIILILFIAVYILKPFERFSKAVSKAINFYQYKTSSKEAQSDALFVRSEYQLVKIEYNNIEYIESV